MAKRYHAAAATTAIAVAILILAVVLIGSIVGLLAQRHGMNHAQYLKTNTRVLQGWRAQTRRTRELARAAVAAAATNANVRAAPTLRADFPIDAVFTWVDANDPAWRRARNAATPSLFHSQQRDPVVVKPRDELFFSVRLAQHHMPWLRQILIVTQRPQVPWWVESTSTSTPTSTPRIVVVHHDEFFDPDVIQPTFNSNVIESQFPRLSMLAEHFVSFNDDTFVGQPMPRDAFFTPTGVPVVRHASRAHARRLLIDFTNAVWTLQLTNASIVCDALNVPLRLPVHVALPQRKSVLERVTRVLKPLTRQWKPLRSSADFPIMYVASCATSPVALPDVVKTGLYRNTRDFESATARPGSPPHLFCINESFDADLFARVLARYSAMHL
jgi:hypothetical protein